MPRATGAGGISTFGFHFKGRAPAKSDDPSSAALNLVTRTRVARPLIFADRFTGDIASVVDTFSAEARLALDTESDPFHRYFEKVCLIQISMRDRDLIVDPLAIGMPDPIRRLLEDPTRTHVIHGADYDVRSLKRSFDLSLGKIFDTLIAASLLNKKQLGLKGLLESELCVAISKSEQRSDWGQRPLTARQLEYARQDTMYLLPLSERLEEELAKKDRLAWLEEECELLRQRPPAPRIFEPDGWRKLKGARLLGDIGRRVLEAAYLWREKTAEAHDRPPFRILRNEALVLIAGTVERAKQVDMAALKKLRVLPKSMDRASLQEALERGLEVAPAAVCGPATASTGPCAEKNASAAAGYVQDPAVRQRLDRLRLARVEWSKVLDLDPGFLIAQSVLERLAKEPPESVEALRGVRGMTRWRIVAIGHSILGVLKSS
jgi:ribonuclease D